MADNFTVTVTNGVRIVPILRPTRTLSRRADLVIRPARIADLSKIVDVLGGRETLEDRFARQRLKLGALLVAWFQQKPVGTLYLWCETAEEPELQARTPGVPVLNSLYVHEDHRCRGIGSALMGHGERLLADKGYSHVVLAVDEDNVRARRLYYRLGFVEWPYGYVTCYGWKELDDGTVVRSPETCRVMTKILR